MWIQDVIARSGILNSRKTNRPAINRGRTKLDETDLFKLDILSFKNKKVLLSGDFFPTTEEAFKEKLIRAKATVMAQLTSETEILICGKYPDWILIEEVQRRGLDIIFIDKASDLFSGTSESHQHIGEPALSYQIPLGV